MGVNSLWASRFKQLLIQVTRQAYRCDPLLGLLVGVGNEEEGGKMGGQLNHYCLCDPNWTEGWLFVDCWEMHPLLSNLKHAFGVVLTESEEILVLIILDNAHTCYCIETCHVVFSAHIIVSLINSYPVYLDRCALLHSVMHQNNYSFSAIYIICLFPTHPHPCLPVSLWTSLLDLLAFGSPLTAHTVDATWTSNSLRLQALRRLLEGKLDCFAFLQAAETFHVQFTLKGNKNRTSKLLFCVLGRPVLYYTRFVVY